MLLVNLTLSFFKRKVSDFIFQISIVFIFLYSLLFHFGWCLHNGHLVYLITVSPLRLQMGTAPGLHIDIPLYESRALLCQKDLCQLNYILCLLYCSIYQLDLLISYLSLFFIKLLNHLTLFSSGFIFVSVSKCLFLSLEKFMEH